MRRRELCHGGARILTVWAAVSLMLLGCQHDRLDLARTETVAVPQDEEFVFGRITQLVNGKPKDWGSHPGFTGCKVFVRNVRELENRSYVLREDGSFAWHLAPGDYVIGNIYWGPPVYASANAHFAVPGKQKVVYIGTLQMVVHPRKTGIVERALDPNAMVVDFTVIDDYDSEVEEFKNKFPDVPEKAIKSLLRFIH